jgi:hypothetical protein
VNTSVPSHATIVVQPFHGLWEVFERPGIRPLFRTRENAIATARLLLKNRSGVIEIRTGTGLVDHRIDLRQQHN